MQDVRNRPALEESWYKTVGLRLRQARLEQQFSLREVARQLHLSEETLTRLESGRWQNLKADRLVIVCRFLRISLDYVCGFSSVVPKRQEMLRPACDSSFTEQSCTTVHRLLRAWAFLSDDAQSMLLSHTETLAASAVAEELEERQRLISASLLPLKLVASARQDVVG